MFDGIEPSKAFERVTGLQAGRTGLVVVTGHHREVGGVDVHSLERFQERLADHGLGGGISLLHPAAADVEGLAFDAQVRPDREVLALAGEQSLHGGVSQRQAADLGLEAAFVSGANHPASREFGEISDGGLRIQHAVGPVGFWQKQAEPQELDGGGRLVGNVHRDGVRDRISILAQEHNRREPHALRIERDLPFGLRDALPIDHRDGKFTSQADFGIARVKPPHGQPARGQSGFGLLPAGRSVLPRPRAVLHPFLRRFTVNSHGVARKNVRAAAPGAIAGEQFHAHAGVAIEHMRKFHIRNDRLRRDREALNGEGQGVAHRGHGRIVQLELRRRGRLGEERSQRYQACGHHAHGRAQETQSPLGAGRAAGIQPHKMWVPRFRHANGWNFQA